MWADSKQYKAAGAIFAEARRRLGITQADLARTLRKPQSFVSSIEAGHRRLDVVEFMVLANALKLDPKKLFSQLVARLTK